MNPVAVSETGQSAWSHLKFKHMSKYLRFSLLTLSVLGWTAATAALSFPAAALPVQLSAEPAAAWQLAQAKPDPRKLPLQKLLDYAESLRVQAGLMSANSVLIVAMMEPSSPLSESDRSVVKNQIALYYRKLAEQEAQSEVAQWARPQLAAVQQDLQQGLFADAMNRLMDLKKALEARKAKQKPLGNVLSEVLMELAEIQLMQGDFDKAFVWANQALGASEHNNNRAFLAQNMLRMGHLYLLKDEEIALANAEMALNFAQMGQALEQMVGAQQLKGEVFLRLGKADQALIFFQEAQKLAAEIQSPLLPQLCIQTALAHAAQNQTKAAQAQLLKAQASLPLQKNAFKQAQNQLSLAQAYAQLEDPEAALRYYQLAEAGFQLLPSDYYRAQVFFGQAELARAKSDWAQAQSLYQQAVNLGEKVPYNLHLGDYQAGLGFSLVAQSQAKAALPLLENALVTFTRFDYVNDLAKREAKEKGVPTLLALADAHFYIYEQARDPVYQLSALQAAFAYLEQSKASIFLKNIKGYNNALSLGNPEAVLIDPYDVRNYLPPDTAALSYAQTPTQDLLQLGIQKTGYQFKRQSLQALLAQNPLFLKHAETLRLYKGQTPDFARLCQVYRQLLSNPQSDLQTLHDLGSVLYQILIQPHAAFLEGRKRLLILPEGALGLIPFETLRDENGHYLVEKMDIQYVQSMDVLYQLQNRQYDPERKPILAWGAAIYEPISYQEEPIESPAELLNLKRKVWNAPDASMREIYGSLYAPHWQPLPGSQAEIEAIQTLFPGTELRQGEEVAETEVKALAADKQLQNYKVLHWAVHGVAVPELPELSALVLSQREESGSEDNYLRMPEIAELGLHADFVNLSACETGLGKLFKGEGMVGLTQAFLQASANRVSVSLWQISDLGTAQFMPAFYRQVNLEQETSYAQALNQTKRDFLRGKRGEKLTHPYFWSPFVLYGRL